MSILNLSYNKKCFLVVDGVSYSIVVTRIEYNHCRRGDRLVKISLDGVASLDPVAEIKPQPPEKSKAPIPPAKRKRRHIEGI